MKHFRISFEVDTSVRYDKHIAIVVANTTDEAIMLFKQYFEQIASSYKFLLEESITVEEIVNYPVIYDTL